MNTDFIRHIQARQDKAEARWGQRAHDDPLWLPILAEELGEVARSFLEPDYLQVREELLDLAAVIASWWDALERERPVRTYPQHVYQRTDMIARDGTPTTRYQCPHCGDVLWGQEAQAELFYTVGQCRRKDQKP